MEIKWVKIRQNMLPPEYDEVLVSVRRNDGKCKVKISSLCNGKWKRVGENWQVIAWAIMPMPYKE